MTMIVPEERGELAKLSGAVSALGGNIVALGTFLGDDASQTLLTMKVQDVSAEDLQKVVAPLVKRIVDTRVI